MIEDRWMKRTKTADGGKGPKQKTKHWGKGKRYRARVRGTDGKEHAKCFHQRSQARHWEATQIEQLHQGTWLDPTRGRISCEEMAKRWLESKINIKASTRAGYHSLIKLINKQWGQTPINTITHIGLNQWARTLLQKGYSPSHTRQACIVLGSILGYAVKDGRLAQNPAAQLDLPRREERRHRYLTMEQVEQLATQIGWWTLQGDGEIHTKGRHGALTRRDKPTSGQTTLQLLVRTLAYTGLRFGEAAALRVRHIDLKRRRLHIEKSITEVNGKQIEGTPKNHRTRNVPIPQFLVADLAQFTATKHPEDYLFESRQHTPVRASNVRAHFDLAAAAIGERGLHLHDLRHTAASLAISSGANVKVVQTMLGHKSAAMTLDVYADLFDHDLDEVAEKMDAAYQEYLGRKGDGEDGDGYGGGYGGSEGGSSGDGGNEDYGERYGEGEES